MQSNVDCVLDDLNDYPDSWVEILNTTSVPVALNRVRLGLTPNISEAWQLPSNQLAGGGHVLIYCDKVASKMHTNFRLESGKGGAVYLFCDGRLVDSVTDIPHQPAPNISYGRHADGSTAWGWQQTPTPNVANCGTICTGLLPDPVFSREGYVMVKGSAFDLTLSLPSDAPAGSVIRYTINGSEPTESATAYNKPIHVATTTVVRAKLFCPGWLSPRSTTHSYIFFPRDLTLPVVSLVTDNKHFYDNKTGIYTKGTYNSSKPNYKHNWRRPVNFEFFEGVGEEAVLNQLCETRVQGGATRDNSLKSLALYALKRFGEKRFRHELFPEDRPGQTDYKSFLLRNAGNDFDYLYMRDAIIQRTFARHTDLDFQAWRPTIVYIDGIYKGILNFRERSTTDNVFTNYDELEDIDMIENWNELKAGDKANYNAFKTFYNEHGHTWDEYEQWMECDEFIDLMLLNLFYNNQDFPGNNIVMWRPRIPEGRWRWIAKDTDFGLGLYGSSASYNTIAWLHDNGYDADRAWANTSDYTRLFRRLMEDDTFRRRFLTKAAVYMGDWMNYEGTWAVWEPMYNEIRTEYPNHRKLINQ